MSRQIRLFSSFIAIAAASAAAPAFAQKAPAPNAAAGAATSASAADYDKELSALVGIAGGLTADDAASRAAKVAPDVARRHAELASAHAQLELTKLARIPRVDATLRYTRL